MTQKHRPVPWEVRGSGPYTVWGETSTIPSRTVSIQLASVLGEANARFIVQACNAHEELLAALQEAETWVSGLEVTLYMAGLVHRMAEAKELLVKLRAALIAKASPQAQ